MSDSTHAPARLPHPAEASPRPAEHEQLAILEFALNHVREAVYLIDAQGRLRYVNIEACRASGYSREDLLRLSVPDLDPDFTRERWQEHWRELRARGVLTFETMHRTRKGRVFPVEITASYFEYQATGYNLALARDLTSIRDSERQLRTLHEVVMHLSRMESSDALCRQAVAFGRTRLEFDRVGLWFIDEAASLMIGTYGTDETGTLRDEREARVPFRPEGLTWEVYSRKEPVVRVSRIPLRNHAHEVVGEGENAVAALWDGDQVIGVLTIDNLLSGQPISDRRLEILRFYATALGHLISRKRAEEALRKAEHEVRRLNAELEERIAVRTEQLRVANRELEAFSYSVSHDLRTPLRSIDGFSRALLEDYADRLDEEGRDHLQRVLRASRRMDQLIDDLLALSRTARVELRRLPVDLSALAGEIAADLHTTEPAREAEWVIAPGLAAEGDHALLRVMLENLLGNAWKFTRRRARARIEVGRENTPQGPAFFVRDNGAGFDVAHAGRLFGAFSRLHTAEEFPGSGIGLATVQRIVDRHGGRTWAEGQPDVGATFYFTLSPTVSG